MAVDVNDICEQCQYENLQIQMFKERGHYLCEMHIKDRSPQYEARISELEADLKSEEIQNEQIWDKYCTFEARIVELETELEAVATSNLAPLIEMLDDRENLHRRIRQLKAERDELRNAIVVVYEDIRDDLDTMDDPNLNELFHRAGLLTYPKEK